MAVSFPSNPVNGDLHSEKGRTWIYDSTSSAWKSIINGTAIDSDDVLEGTNNLYFTNSRADARTQVKLGNVSGHILPDTDVTYDLGSATNKFRDLYLSGNSIQLGTRAITQDNIPDVNLSIAPETLEIQVDAPAAGQDTAWLWTWEQSTLPYARRTITNSPEVTVPLYKQGTYTVNNYAAYDIHGSMTQTHTLYFKWIDSAGTDNLISWATNNPSNPISDSHPDINGGVATDVQRISVNVPATITPPTLTAPSVSYTVTNNANGAYTFSGSATGDNPNLGPMYKGGTYTFNVSATGHPFYLTTDNGTNFSAGTYFGEYTSGVTGSRTDSGTVTFVVPSNAPDTLYYQCGNHSSMRGAITIKDLAVETNINGNYVVYAMHTQEGHKTPVELRPIPSLVNQMCLVYDASTNKFVPQDLATYVENTPSFENKIREVAGTAELVVEDGSAVIAKVNVYDDSTYLPLTGNNAGDQAFATDTNILYIWDGSAWQQAGASNTDDLTEGSTNLFYTDTRVGTYLNTNGYDTATNIIATITDSAPATLDTLNELAAALGDDPNFATTTANNIATKLPLAGGTMTGNLAFTSGNITKNGTLTITNTGQTARSVRLGTYSDDSASYFSPLNDADSHQLIDLGVGDGQWRNFNISGQATVGSLNSLGNVGIGTSSPAELLHLALPAATNGDMIRLSRAAGAYNFHLGVTGSSNFYLSGNANETLLDVTYTGATNHRSSVDNSLRLFKTSGSTWNYIEWYSDAGDQSARSAYIGTDNNGNLQLYGENSSHVVMAGAGNVGIGTWLPEAKLHVETGSAGAITPNAAHDDVIIEGSGNTGINIFSPNSSYQYLAFGDTEASNSGYVRYQHSNNQMVLRTAGQDTVYINDGNVGIGDSSPAYTLDVNGEVAFTRNTGNAFIANIQSGGGGGRVLRYNDTTNAKTNWIAGVQYNIDNGYEITPSDTAGGDVFSTPAFVITSAGNVGIGTNGPSYKLAVNGSFGATAITETSSIAYKENVRPIDDGLGIIEQLAGVIYDRKDGSKNNEAGLIAEDVDQILPNLVSKIDGAPEGIQYTKLTAYLIEAVKTLSAEVKSLKEQLK